MRDILEFVDISTINKKKIFRYNDDISFRKCTLFDTQKTNYGDCTNFDESNIKEQYYHCEQYGVHFHCTKHPEIELDIEKERKSAKVRCPKCNNIIDILNLNNLINDCLKMLNREIFKDASLIRLDDWYTPEIKHREITSSNYWIKTDVKTDKDGDTIIIVYVGYVGTKEKSQFFIKPEKCQLTSDHKDLDPAKILSMIEVTLKDRTLSQNYE